MSPILRRQNGALLYKLSIPIIQGLQPIVAAMKSRIGSATLRDPLIMQTVGNEVFHTRQED